MATTILLTIVTVCIVMVVFGIGLPIVIDRLVNDRLKRLEEGILALAAKHDGHDESMVNLAKFCNNLSFQIQVDRYNYNDHMYRYYHGEADMDKIIKWTNRPATDTEMINFRNWGRQINEAGRVQGFLPREDYDLGGAQDQ